MSVFFLCKLDETTIGVLVKFFYHAAFYWQNLCKFANPKFN